MLGRKLDSLPGAHRRPQVRPLCPWPSWSGSSPRKV